MKNKSLDFLAFLSCSFLVVVVVQVCEGVTTPTNIIRIRNNRTSSLAEASGTNDVARVKRGYRGHSTGVAYKRHNDAGQLRTVGSGHGGGEGHGKGHRGEEGGGGERRNSVGEDGTHTGDFKSYGVGYEHRHGDHCEESKCGYNIRHCPHGCVFNSFVCGGGLQGPQYDTCCC